MVWVGAETAVPRVLKLTPIIDCAQRWFGFPTQQPESVEVGAGGWESLQQGTASNGAVGWTPLGAILAGVLEHECA